MEAYSLGSVNVDSLKEALLFLSGVYPFADETAKEAFTAHVNALDSAGNPNLEAPSAVIPPVVAEAPPAAEAPAETPEAETPAEDSTETTEEATGPDGASVANTATANESNDAPAEPTADEKIAALEAQLADAKAAKEQGAG